MLKHEEGSRSGEDIEDVHDMRVATRRMRSIFHLMDTYFKPRIVSTHEGGLRTVARALGKVRDLDVLIEALETFYQTLPAEQQPHLVSVIDRLKARRESARKKLNNRLDDASYARFVEGFSQFLTTPGMGVRDGDGVTNSAIRYNIPVLIFEHLAAVRAFDSLLSDASDATLHQLRIEFKRLRYLVAMYADVLSPQVKDFIKLLKEIQDHLGTMNDAVVAREQLGEMLTDGNADEAAVLQLYVDSLEAKAATMRSEFDDLWRKFNTKTVQRQLANAVAGL
jgi:CHAD domain-containing protein